MKGGPTVQLLQPLLPGPTILHLSRHTSREPLTPTGPISIIAGMRLSHSGTCLPAQDIESWE